MPRSTWTASTSAPSLLSRTSTPEGNARTVEFTYYPDTDSLFITLYPDSEKRGADVVVVSAEMNVDVAEDGTSLGIDIHQDASKVVDLSKPEAKGTAFGIVRRASP